MVASVPVINPSPLVSPYKLTVTPGTPGSLASCTLVVPPGKSIHTLSPKLAVAELVNIKPASIPVIWLPAAPVLIRADLPVVAFTSLLTVALPVVVPELVV